jgi:hypothetical protein
MAQFSTRENQPYGVFDRYRVASGDSQATFKPEYGKNSYAEWSQRTQPESKNSTGTTSTMSRESKQLVVRNAPPRAARPGLPQVSTNTSQSPQARPIWRQIDHNYENRELPPMRNLTKPFVPSNDSTSNYQSSNYSSSSDSTSNYSSSNRRLSNYNPSLARGRPRLDQDGDLEVRRVHDMYGAATRNRKL